MPKVSVIMGVYNQAGSLPRALASIRGQSFDDWELVVVDDGSTDGTWAILKEMAETDHRVVIERNKRNVGLAATLNRCIEFAEGEFLARHDGDDYSLPDRLNKQVRFLECHPDTTVVGTHAFLYREGSAPWGALRYPEIPLRRDWVKGPMVAHPTVMMRKKDIVHLGGYNPAARRLQDYELWLKLLENGHTIRNIPETLYSLHWDLSDYGRRRFRYRLQDSRLKLRAVRSLGLSAVNYIYLAKPIVAGLIPPSLVYWYHFRKFGSKRGTDHPGVHECAE